MSHKEEKIIQPIDADLDSVVAAIVPPITPKSKDVKDLDGESDESEIGPKESKLSVLIAPKKISQSQMPLALGIAKQREIDGVGMGVLSDGTAFLSGRGLAEICGLSNSVIVDLGNDWNADAQTSRVKRIKEILRARGLELAQPYITVKINNSEYNAYPDAVCLAVLEYYAFDAGQYSKERARESFRFLAGSQLRAYIYDKVGFDPRNAVPEVWRHFHARVALTYNSLPDGYFGIFKEIADMVVTLGQAGLYVDEHFVPDISVGKAWSNYWMDNNLEAKFGARIHFEHNYPDYFPQAKSNPQSPWCYPDNALGIFRKWMRENYIGQGKLETYLAGQIKRLELPKDFAERALSIYKKDALDN